MNLTEIRNGSRVILDSNILLYASSRRSREAVELVERIAHGAVEGFLNTVVVGELCHRWMMEECKDRGIGLGGNPSRALAKNRTVITQLSNYVSLTSAVLNGRFAIKPVEGKDFLVALQLQKRWGLMTNDSLLLALAERLGIQEIVTADANFDHVRGYIVYRPGDLPGPSISPEGQIF